MSTGYSWEGIRQVGLRATLLGARHVPERLCGGLCLLGALYQVLALLLFSSSSSRADTKEDTQGYVEVINSTFRPRVVEWDMGPN